MSNTTSATTSPAVSEEVLKQNYLNLLRAILGPSDAL